ncbi:aminopeptidase N [Nocardioides campestrisoli]|uniref:aminopeptidase N n=1 Tax=Nocardioides campestrisoli TaxID=2736757 RepID=UPI00163D730F|nr:aminopeptidase N [Nocardioides campestrisoli]
MSLTLGEARARRELLADVSYDLHLDLTGPEHAECRVVVRFACSRPGAETFLELAHGDRVTVDGEPAAYADGRIVLRDLAARTEVVVEARVPYVTDGDGLHVFTDPADQETYVSAYAGMDVAQRIFPCFDQNDLKARVTLSVTAPERWSVLANGRLERAGGAGEPWRFAPTPPIPVAMFVLCAGPWHSVRWEHAGLPFGWHARRSLAAALDRDVPELRRVTEACFEHYGELFDEPYPFDSYDQVMVPGHNWGAMETPGCVTYRDELLPQDPPGLAERRRRTVIVAHEMAHMWFGNLVTMTWWEDTWLQESFADHMGFRVAEAAAGVKDAWADFLVQRAPQAYLADQRRSTHPVAARAEEVPDVDTAAGNFDAISYAKGNACLQQLVTWLGEESFLAGVNVYLSRHRFGNATLADFVDALSSASDRDVRGWVDDWLRTTGFDTVRVQREGPALGLLREGSRRHRLRVDRYDAALEPLSAEMLEIADGVLPLLDAALVLPNAGGETFARVRLDPASWQVVTERLGQLPDPTSRALLWAGFFDQVSVGDLTAAGFVDLLERHLPGERNVAVVTAVLGWTGASLLPRHVPESAVAEVLARVAGTCRAALRDLRAPDGRHAWDLAAPLTRDLAGSTSDVALLRSWLDSPEATTRDGVAIDSSLRWTALRRLAALGEADAEAVAREQDRDRSATGELGAARALAARPTPEAKEAAWAVLFEDPVISNRMFTAVADGFWDPARASLLRGFVPRYVEAAPQLVTARGPGFGRLVGAAFPRFVLDASELAAFDERIARGVPTVLRRAWQDELDVRRLSGR